MEKGLLIPAYIEGIRSRKDKTISLTLGTQELSPDKAGELFSINGQLVTAYLSVKGISHEDQEIIDSIEPEQTGKTPSQRLRNVLYLLWKQDSEGFKDKNMHYEHHMGKILDHLKAKIK